MERAFIAALQRIPGIGTAGIKSLINYFGSARQAWQADRRDLFLSRVINEKSCNNLLEQREKIDIPKLAEKWKQQGIKLCSLFDEQYPELLKSIYSPPLLLFYRGVLPASRDIIGIVGSRQASAYGKNAATMLAAGLAARGFWIASGAARGIDTAAHQGALEHGKTIAVLGCGVDIAYPYENRKLLEEIAENGAVISEYSPGIKPHPGHFPARNRIINGLSRGIVVVEAAEKSGALITADFALDEGRDVFAVPGSIFSKSSRGTHRLIKQGAKLVEGEQDILEEYGLAAVSESKNVQLTIEESLVYEQLSCDTPVGVDEIVEKTKLIPSTVTYILLQFELRGLAIECAGQRYVRVAREGHR